MLLPEVFFRDGARFAGKADLRLKLKAYFALGQLVLKGWRKGKNLIGLFDFPSTPVLGWRNLRYDSQLRACRKGGARQMIELSSPCSHESGLGNLRDF